MTQMHGRSLPYHAPPYSQPMPCTSLKWPCTHTTALTRLFLYAHGKKWIEEVQRWKEEGCVGTPPGLSEPPPERDADKRDYTNAWPGNYYLRPETVESIFYMWRTTGDVKWREWGYAIFEAINRNSRTEYGFASVKGIDTNVGKIDDMPSYFLAETFKYLYLLFDDPHSITFNHWVFNTEAHLIPIFSWNEMEKKAFNITS